MHRLLWYINFFVRIILLGIVISARAAAPLPEYLTVRNGLPQGFIKSIIQDRTGFIWLATRDGLCRYDGVRFKIYYHDPQNLYSLSFSSIYELKEDPTRGGLWVRTENNHIDFFNPVTTRAERISGSSAFRKALGHDVLSSIHPDKHGNIWVATQLNGFFRLSPDGSVSHRHWAAMGDSILHVTRTLITDRHGFVWLTTNDGLYRYNPANQQLNVFTNQHGLPQTAVWGVHERANGELMLSFPGKVAIFNSKQGIVRQVITVPGQFPNRIPVITTDRQGRDFINQHSFTDKTGLEVVSTDPKLEQYPLLSSLVDVSNVLWIGTNGDGVIKYDLNKVPFRGRPYTVNFQTDLMTQQLGIPAGAIPAPIRQQWGFGLRYLFDKQQNLWVAGPNTPLHRYIPAQRRFDAIQPVGIPAQWLSTGPFRLSVMAKGAEGEMWGLLAPNQRVVVRYNAAERTFSAFPLSLPARHPYRVMAMLVDGGRIYLATQQHGLLRADLSAQRLIRWRNNPTDPNSLPVNDLLCLAQDPTQYKYLWIGTFGNGLCRFDKLTGKVQRFTDRDGLPNNVIYGIQPDSNGHLWLSTNRGLCRLDTRTFDIRNYTSDDGLPSDEFHHFHDVTLPDKRIVFGTINGYIAFDPRRINDDTFEPKVALTSLRINNQSVNTQDQNSPLDQDINETREVVLDHRQNFLTFEFAALQFNQTGKNHYRYKLIGLEDEWVYNGTQATATYTNLSPGTYTFVVNASNTSNIWSPYTRQVRIVIEPPVWATWWAYTLYGLLLVGAVTGFLWFRINQVRMQHRVELQEQESLQLKALDEIKSRFFSNITHEFRTPLTLILSPLEQLLRDIDNPQHHSRLSVIHRNASQLLRLINQLLDLAKLEAGNMPVQLTQGDLVDFVEQCVSSFIDEAEHRHIQLQVQHQISHRFYWFDADKVEKVLNNLVANALKFTGKNGTIDVSVSTRLPAWPTALDGQTTTGQLRLTVTDTGVGIEGQKLPHIFDRFYQADSSNNRTVRGSGIGLALVKELVDSMKGHISVESLPGQGTTFIVELPCQPAISTGVVPETPVHPLPVQGAPTENAANPESAYILLVEDNDDLAAYITEVLSPYWHVQRANNGRSGVELATTNGPDLIISDVLMPELNGYELCRQVKSNPATNHIPIILLTARASAESRVEGLTAGADDYLAKPFQVEELRWRVRNRLDQQRRLRLHYRTQLLREGNIPTTAVAQTSVEDGFLKKVYTTLEAHLDDSTFGVEPLAEAVNMSRMHLHRKLKALTGMSANELIRAVRLNRATELLLTNVPVSEVAYRVGFESPAYFSRVFKEQYGLTPSEFAEQSRLKSA